MIVSIHLADIGPGAMPAVLIHKPDPADVPGLRYAETTLTAPLGEALLPSPNLGRAGLIAAWDDDASLDEFSAHHPLARRMAGGWQTRLEPLRVFGAWPGLSGLPAQEQPVDEDEPVAVLTLGRLRLRRLRPFLKASARAEGEAVTHQALLASTGLARPPGLVATFSLWRSAAEMRDYAVGTGGAHPAATSAHNANPFHHESAFLRFRPYAASGDWDGRNPLAS